MTLQWPSWNRYEVFHVQCNMCIVKLYLSGTVPYVEHCVGHCHFLLCSFFWRQCWMYTLWDQCIRIIIPLMDTGYIVYNIFRFVHK